MVRLNELIKRKEHGYDDETKNLDSIMYSPIKNLYPYYSYIKYHSNNVEKKFHETLVIEYALDCVSKYFRTTAHSEPFVLDIAGFNIICGFQTKEDFITFLNGLTNKLNEDGYGRVIEFTLTTDRKCLPTLQVEITRF